MPRGIQRVSTLDSLSEAIKMRREQLVKNDIEVKDDDEDDDWD